MDGLIRRQNDVHWTRMEYERLIGGIQIISPLEILDGIGETTVELRLESGTEKVGLAKKDGLIVFE